MKHGLGILFLLSLATLSSEAQTMESFDFSRLPDTQEARSRYLTALVTANWNSAVLFPPTFFSSSHGRVQVSVDRKEDFFFVCFAREKSGTFPLAAPGNAIVQRNYLRNGDLVQAKLFLADDPSTYIRLYPYNERTKADIVVYGAVTKQGIVLPQIFYYQLRDPVSRIIASTGSAFDWGVLFRAPGQETSALRFSRALREGRMNGGSPGYRLCSSLSIRDTVDDFLSAHEKEPGTREMTDSLALPFSDDPDPRRTAAYKPFPPYEPGRGVPLSAVSALTHAEFLKNPESLVAAFIQEGEYRRRILLIPGFDKSGLFGLEAYDPVSRAFVDWPELVAERRSARVRLVRIPVPPA